MLQAPLKWFSFLKYFLYFWREGKRGKHQCAVASCAPLTGDLALNPGVCPDWELNWQLSASKSRAQSTEPPARAPWSDFNSKRYIGETRPLKLLSCGLDRWLVGDRSVHVVAGTMAEQVILANVAAGPLVWGVTARNSEASVEKFQDVLWPSWWPQGLISFSDSHLCPSIPPVCYHLKIINHICQLLLPIR